MIQRAHRLAWGLTQRHGQQHGHGPGYESDGRFARLLLSKFSFIMRAARLARPRKHCIVARPADGLDELLGLGQRRIEHHLCPVGHEVDMRRLHTGRSAQRLLHVVLTGGTRHAEHRKRERFCGLLDQLANQVRRVTGLGQGGNGKIHWRRLYGRGQPCRSHAHLVDRHALNCRERLARAPHTGPAMHSIDL